MRVWCQANDVFTLELLRINTQIARGSLEENEFTLSVASCQILIQNDEERENVQGGHVNSFFEAMKEVAATVAPHS